MLSNKMEYLSVDDEKKKKIVMCKKESRTRYKKIKTIAVTFVYTALCKFMVTHWMPFHINSMLSVTTLYVRPNLKGYLCFWYAP